jgi:hypothetical protein
VLLYPVAFRTLDLLQLLPGALHHRLHTTQVYDALNALALAAFRSDSADSATRALHIIMEAAVS